MRINRIGALLLTVSLIWSLLLPMQSAEHVHAADPAPVMKKMQGYTPISGSWVTEGNAAVSGSSGPDANAFFMSSTGVGSYFEYEATITVDENTPYGVGSLVFRSNADGSKGYVVSLDPNMDKVRLFDWATNQDVGQPYALALEPGKPYHVKVSGDGSSLRVYVDEQMAQDVQSAFYSSGNVGLHIYNGKVHFTEVSTREINTNITGWNTSSGQWTLSSQGLAASASENENAYAIASTYGDDLTYEADILIRDRYAVAAMLLRSNASGSQAYALQVDPNAGRIRLIDTNGDRELGVFTTELEVGEVYRVRIKAEQSKLEVYFGSGYAPKITVTDHAYPAGQVGLQLYNGAAVFQNMTVSVFRTNMGGWSADTGAWTPHLEGLKGVSTGTGTSSRMSASAASDLVLEGDVTVASAAGAAGLLFRSNANGNSGYVAEINAAANQIRLLRAGDRSVIASSPLTVQIGKSYHLEAAVNGADIKIYLEAYAEPAISVQNNEFPGGLTGLEVTDGTAYFQNIYLMDKADYQTEQYRPQYHFTQPRRWASDPNGLVFFQGEYHLFHQDGGQWAHAVSTDLVHWKLLPIAIEWNEMGHAWSGSAVADTENKSGLFNGVTGGGLIAYYTSFNPDKWNGNQKIGVAYSSDKGRTWSFYEGNPVIENIGGAGAGWDFRDPKVVWDEEHNQWVMVVSGGDHIRFFTSVNLLDWTAVDSFGYGAYVHNGGVWECPDFFPLVVDGVKKWVLMISTGARAETNGSDAEYFIGSFDGQRFTSDNPPETVLRHESGRDMYAAMTFANMPDGRRVELGWMSNWDYPFAFPTSPWKGQMSVPRELMLKQNENGGIHLVQKPIGELETLRGDAMSWSNEVITPESGNLLAGVTGSAYEIVAELELPVEQAAAEFGFGVRELGGEKTVIGYQTGSNTLFVDRTAAGKNDFTELFRPVQEANLSPDANRHIQLRIFVDESSVEVFGQDGSAVISSLIFPGAARDGMSFYAKGGNVKVVSMDVYPLKSIWSEEAGAGETAGKIVMDAGTLELSVGQAHRLYASVLPHSAADKALTWSTSNAAVAGVSGTDSRSVQVTAAGEGRAVLTASTQAGGVVSQTVVTVGKLQTNLTGWHAATKGEWLTTLDGISGRFDKDSSYMSAVSARNFTYEADLKLDSAGGAASMLFRANADGSSGYYFNIDPNMKALRLFYKDNGAFQDDQLVAKVPAFISTGKTYRIRIVASGSNIKIYFDGGSEPIIDVNDVTFARGYFGLNVFGGKVSYQNVIAAAAEPLQEKVYKIVNPNSGKVLEADNGTNGAHVRIQTDSGAESQKWYVEEAVDGTFTIRGALSGKALDASGSDNGSPMQIWRNFGFGNQRFTLPDNEDGTIGIVAVNSGKGLDVDSGRTEAGTAVQLWERNDFAAQKWTLVELVSQAGGDGSVGGDEGDGSGGGESGNPDEGSGDPDEGTPGNGTVSTDSGVIGSGLITTLMDGQAVSFAAAKTEQTAEGSLTTIVLDADELKRLLGTGKNHSLAIHARAAEEVRLEGLTAAEIDLLSGSGSTLTIHTAYGIFPLEASKDWKKNLASFGSTVSSEDIKVSGRFGKASEQVLKLSKATAAKGSYVLLADPILAEVSLSYGDLSVEMSSEGKTVIYLALPDQMDPAKPATAAAVYADGSISPLPTVIERVGQTDYARVIDWNNNSMFTLVANGQTFLDTDSHWAKEAIDSLSSRLILTGTGEQLFSPKRDVTRSEFAAVLVRSLGFMKPAAAGESPFLDVKDGMWEHDAVFIAAEKGLISGYDDGNFHGSASLTREQGMVMLANAIKHILGDSFIALTPAEEAEILKHYGDGEAASAWARPSIAYLIKAGIVKGDASKQILPKQSLSRAQAATIIHNLLKQISYI
ncbi:GH32 C-terminal domain-containing protein [Paenibacillus sp. LPE1-1-1.1]|uniref:GH32 C-terminal domain-containing protein n=1 Tax=Paenibacillus sp. LPE1-1-1.1 TaxID=3135230 RepID=UPI00341BA1F5